MAFVLTRDMIVVENDDPRITYSHGWERALGEPGFCTGGSFHRTYTMGATARFEFEGSHITLIGHKSAAHGNIKINIDGHPGIATINTWGTSRAVVPFQQLFEHKFANPGLHWIEVVNDLSGAEITIDAFAYRPMAPGRAWKSPLSVKLVTIGDNDPRVEYSGKWRQYIDSKPCDHLGSGSVHYAESRYATATVSFESTHFWIIGDVDKDRGRYSVSVDGGLFEVFSGYEPKWRPFVILYERRFGHPGPHHVVIRNEEDKVFGLDAIVYEAFTPVTASSIPAISRVQNAADPAWSQAEHVA